ncbi:hypothetical protein FDENT_10729 [Fusarium denticulatum]|uniref:Uncharacterized protein n=1 Tax=Fusarium denticulatum TaxID=48507 RepID=A0A8H5WVK4_9HYPO|nr:hypothetical protein FDENT_10729 [Fusarium denticulatum]
MAAAAFQAAGTVAKIAISLIEKHEAESAAQLAQDRQNQIMGALNSIQDTLQSTQIQQENLADIGMLHSSLTILNGWQNYYIPAVQNNDTEQINSYLLAFNNKGEGGAEDIVQNFFDVLTGQGEVPPGQSGATPLIQLWHNQSYDKMYTPDANGKYTFTLKNYLDDFDKALGWALGRAGFALICQIIALEELARKTTTLDELKNEVKNFSDQFTANANNVFNMAYDHFPPFVKKFKLNYQDEGSNLTNWFRMWRNGSHVKNYNPIAGGPNFQALTDIDYPPYEIYPAACDDAEGIYPEVEFRFDEADHPLKGLATIYSRAGGLPLLLYNTEGRNGLTTATNPLSYSPEAQAAQVSQVTFNVLPVSTQYSHSDAPAFVLLLSQGIDTQGWAWDIGSASPLAYWIYRDDGAMQSTWVRTVGSPELPPGQQANAATGPNPVDDGQHLSNWEIGRH